MCIAHGDDIAQRKVGDLIWAKMCKLYHSNKKRAKRSFWKEAEVTFFVDKKKQKKIEEKKHELYGGDAERRSLKAAGQRSERCHWEGFRHQLGIEAYIY